MDNGLKIKYQTKLCKHFCFVKVAVLNQQALKKSISKVVELGVHRVCYKIHLSVGYNRNTKMTKLPSPLIFPTYEDHKSNYIRTCFMYTVIVILVSQISLFCI